MTLFLSLMHHSSKKVPVFFHDKFEKTLAYKGKIISLYDGENQYRGTIDSINLQGQLVFKLLNGQKKVFSSGDITL